MIRFAYDPIYNRFALSPHWLAGLELNSLLSESEFMIDDVAEVVVKNRASAIADTKSPYGDTFSIEDIINARPVAQPLTELMFAQHADGAVIAVLGTDEAARKYARKPAYFAGIGWGSGNSILERRDHSISAGTAIAAERAYEMAGVGPEDIGVAQVHDAFSSGVIIHIEELGLCPKGEGGFFVWEGNTEIDGKIPVNTDGGVVGRGHPIGATGGAQIAELVRQLRGEAGKRQVKSPDIGLTHNVGGPGSVASVVVLGRK